LQKVSAARIGVALGLLENAGCLFGTGSAQHFETTLAAEIITDGAARCGRVNLERRFTTIRATRIVAIEQPLTAIDGGFLIAERCDHFDAVSDA
jgi:hypothetical protein